MFVLQSCCLSLLNCSCLCREAASKKIGEVSSQSGCPETIFFLRGSDFLAVQFYVLVILRFTMRAHSRPEPATFHVLDLAWPASSSAAYSAKQLQLPLWKNNAAWYSLRAMRSPAYGDLQYLTNQDCHQRAAHVPEVKKNQASPAYLAHAAATWPVGGYVLLLKTR